MQVKQKRKGNMVVRDVTVFSMKAKKKKERKKSKEETDQMERYYILMEQEENVGKVHVREWM